MLTGGALREWTGTEDEDIDSWVAQLDQDLREVAEPADEYHAAELREDVVSDLELLAQLHELADLAATGDDPKNPDVDELRQIATDPQASQERTVGWCSTQDAHLRPTPTPSTTLPTG